MAEHPSIATTVFAIEELLESILIYLSIDRLLLLKRVCSQWNHVITHSPSLQKILFLRPATLLSLSTREHNPLFETYLKTISYADGPTSTSTKAPSAHLEMNPKIMRTLLTKCPPSWRSMLAFQPPCSYNLTMPSLSVFDITVKEKHEGHVPIMVAVELASKRVEQEAERKRNRRISLDSALRGRFALVREGRLVKEGEGLKRRRGENGDGDGDGDGEPSGVMEARRRAIEIAIGSSG
ncbi:hypothetical protein EJ08DRAFT_157403 [Tothia fuscella]|uniref:F-box domain-containing protein n=1 Tax=Tothia fuscella TaxID=1048955 RepID=A0A9P4U4I4_9PEZI|nr:hypothetical protein EJ08DRAFT_157403 [Tothia fuscella]